MYTTKRKNGKKTLFASFVALLEQGETDFNGKFKAGSSAGCPSVYMYGQKQVFPHIYLFLFPKSGKMHGNWEIKSFLTFSSCRHQ